MSADFIEIDGAQGEGGGQIVRTALSLSAATGRPVRLVNMRANRQPPGLRAQHLAAVQAAASICRAKVAGGEMGSQTLQFVPGPVRAGRYRFDVGTAGSACLVLQTVAMPLALADGDSQVEITGGTHNPRSPCFEYLEAVWLHFMRLIGFKIEVSLLRAGFYPKGGGRIAATISGRVSVESLKPLNLTERGDLQAVDGLSAVANLPINVAQRQRQAALRELEKVSLASRASIAIKGLEALDRGTVCFIRLRYERTVTGFFSLGARGKPSEVVGMEAGEAARKFHASEFLPAADRHIADQMLVPLALVPASSEIRVECITNHTLTNAEVIRQMTGRSIRVEGQVDEPGTVRVE